MIVRIKYIMPKNKFELISACTSFVSIQGDSARVFKSTSRPVETTGGRPAQTKAWKNTLIDGRVSRFVWFPVSQMLQYLINRTNRQRFFKPFPELAWKTPRSASNLSRFDPESVPGRGAYLKDEHVEASIFKLHPAICWSNPVGCELYGLEKCVGGDPAVKDLRSAAPTL